jgi:hypothetical protein
VSRPLYQLKAEFFKTLGHPARIRVLELLSQRDHSVAEMVPEVGIEPTNLSQQLAVLRRAGDDTQGGLRGHLLTDQSGRCRVARGGPPDHDRGADRARSSCLRTPQCPRQQPGVARARLRGADKPLSSRRPRAWAPAHQQKLQPVPCRQRSVDQQPSYLAHRSTVPTAPRSAPETLCA